MCGGSFFIMRMLYLTLFLNNLCNRVFFIFYTKVAMKKIKPQGQDNIFISIISFYKFHENENIPIFFPEILCFYT